ncbi:MAG: hypothetical protein KGQ46_10470 [Hyphomicrobiales bacterium]|nr:hypothetical protein [Hyphomicrobiales bacterium]MDE2115108.1 hypothetical protein [Hyphomicrobiales bacterium]
MINGLAFGLVLAGAGAQAASLPALHLGIAGAPQVMFTPKRDACDGNDVPDAPVRAYRDAQGNVVMFGLHYVNRAWRGPDLDHLKLDCHVVLASKFNPDPAAFDDYSWITALWTRDGRNVDALVHEEYHANEYKGACAFSDYLKCWYNTILEVHSGDDAGLFSRAARPVVAAAPFGSNIGQGRHRGFFNPSNIFVDRGFGYFFASTTGWDGQKGGVCLFRSATPGDPQSWRAYDGAHFATRFVDPYHLGASLAEHCAIVAPFPAPVGAVVRQRGSGLWLAVFMAAADRDHFPVSGFYFATAKNLLDWSLPHLLIANSIIYDDPCHAGDAMLAYPSLLASNAGTRLFFDFDRTLWLYYARLGVEGCNITGARDLMRVPIQVERRKD